MAPIETERLNLEESNLHPIWRLKNRQHHVKTMGEARRPPEVIGGSWNLGTAAARRAVLIVGARLLLEE